MHRESKLENSIRTTNLLAQANESASAQAQLEEASPSHLKDRLHAAEVNELEESLKAQAEISLNGDSNHQTLLESRVSEIESRIQVLKDNAITRSESVYLLRLE